MNDFEGFGLHPGVDAGIETAGYKKPTPIQAKAIPSVLAGRDVMGLAQTGTGKTAAFVLPILSKLIKGRRGTLRALVVAPTRELAEQIHEAITVLASRTGLRSTTVYGGVNIRPQINQLRRGVDILVACPGRLLDHVGRGTVDLSGVKFLVLDEADHMFDMGFLPDIRRIIKAIPQDRQTLMFSATMPREISHLAREALTDPETIKVDRTAPAETVSHAIYPVAQHQKLPMLKRLLEHADTGSVLVFTRTKHRARSIGAKLAKAGYHASSIQGNLSQSQRKKAMDGFRDGTHRILVATDIAARGIDVTRVSHVINYDIPDTPDAYIHRIGRTGRAARNGDAYTLATNEDRLMVRSIERLLGNALDRRHLDDFDYDTPAPAPQRGARPARPARPAKPARPGSRRFAGKPETSGRPNRKPAAAKNGKKRTKRRAPSWAR